MALSPTCKRTIKWTLVILMILLVILLIIVGYIWRYISEEPTIKVDYFSQLNDLTRPQNLTTENNGDTLIHQACRLYEQVDQEIPQPEFQQYDEAFERFCDLTTSHQNQVTDWLQTYKNTWDTLTPAYQSDIESLLEYGLGAVAAYGDYFVFYHTDDIIHYALDDAYTNQPFTMDNDRIIPPGCIPYTALNGKGLPGFPHIFFHNIPTCNMHPDSKVIRFHQVRQELEEDYRQGKLTDTFFQAIAWKLLESWKIQTEDPSKLSSYRLSDLEISKLRTWIQSQNPAWDLFGEGVLQEHVWREYQKNEYATYYDWLTWEIAEPNIDLWDIFINLGEWRLRCHLADGDFNQIIHDCNILLHAGHHLRRHPVSYIYLPGHRIDSLVFTFIHDILDTVPLNDHQYQSLQMLLRDYDRVPFKKALAAQRLEFYDKIQKTFTNDSSGNGHITLRFFQLWCWNAPIDDFWYYVRHPRVISFLLSQLDRHQTLALADTYFSHMENLGDMPPYASHHSNLLQELRDWDEYPGQENHCLILGISGISPVTDEDDYFNRLIGVSWRPLCYRDALLTIIALKRYHLKHKTYPDSLAALLQAGFLDVLPCDIYHDGPLIYHRSEEDFVLYSYDHDYDDDNSRLPLPEPGFKAFDGDWVFHPRPD